MADNIFPAVWQVFDANGDPAAMAKAYFYDTGTTNARTVYSDVGGTTPHASPLVADGNGVMPEVFVTGGTAVKVVVTESDGTALYTQDPVTRTAVSSAASGISFTPTAEIAQTNVQDAIEQVQTNLEAGSFTNVTVSGNLTFGGTALTDITGADTKLVSGTAGANTDFGLWNADGDLVGGSMTYTRGSLIVGGAAAWNKLAVGTSGQVLTSDGTDAVWSAPSSGLTFLSSVDFASDATADFTLSADYDFHQFVLNNVVPVADNVNLYVRTSTDGGSTFDSGVSDYNWSWIGSISSSNAVQILNDSAGSVIELAFGAAGVGSAAGEDGLSGVIYVLGHHLAKQTRVMGKVVYTDSTGANRVMDIGGARLSAADVDAIRFFFSSDNLESGTITHYGGKNA